MKRVKSLNELKGHTAVFITSDQHPQVISEINLVGVHQTAREKIGEDLKKWIKNKSLYIK